MIWEDPRVHPLCMTLFGFHIAINKLHHLGKVTSSLWISIKMKELAALKCLWLWRGVIFLFGTLCKKLVNNCGASEMLPCLKTSKWACPHFTDTGRKQAISWVRDKGLCYSQHSRSQELHACISSPCSPSPTGMIGRDWNGRCTCSGLGSLLRNLG